MKIAHLSAHYRPIIGGQEVYITNLIEVCKRNGFESKVFQVFRGERASDNYCVPRLKFFSRFFPSLDRKWLNYMISLLRPRELFKSDVIISHYAFHATPLEKVRDKTIILSHGVEWKVNDQTPNDSACEQNAKECLGRFLHVVNDTHYLRQLGINVPAAEGFFTEIVPGTWFIPNCVDTSHFKPGDGLKEFEGKKMILVPRQMVHARGIHLAIEAFSKIASDHPDLEMCLLGKRHRGAASYIQQLDKMITDLGLQNRIYFRDPVPNMQMPEWFNSATVTLIPTLEKEGTSLSALESMSCGIATVSTNVAGLTDLPTLQCEPNAESMGAALIEAFKNSTHIGESQRVIVNDIFNMNNWGDAWMQVIRTISQKSIQ
jgi:glycosyltransferase involved in cell wall biosynthesis